MNKLVELVQSAKRVVILTGAGISTSAGIPDFRGPTGIWTKEQQEKKESEKKKEDSTEKAKDTTEDDSSNKKRKRAPVAVDFDQAAPTLTHRALTFLVEKEHFHFVVTQNVDGLHRRSGLSRDHHAVLHGCVFTEVCDDCRVEHFRDHDVGGMSFQKTGRKCYKCGGDLVDCLLDWEDALPAFDFERSQQYCEEADLVIALGTSLRIEPAGSLPTLCKKFVIVNLQETPYDKKANLIIRSPVDNVMSQLVEALGYGSDWDSTSLSSGVKIERHWERPEPVED
jgi:mono-ADP-ribosyltransferase sirtuin 6